MQRNISLDVLRGVAILFVVFHHANPEVLPKLPELTGVAGAVYWFIKNVGWSGVDLFFILSGFLIGGIILSEIEQSSSIRIPRFYLSRGFKIWPSYLLFLLVGFAALSLPWVSAEAGGFSAISAFLAHLFFLQNYLPPTHPYHFWNISVGPAWSLAVEEHFYLLLPVILFVIRGRIATRLVPMLLTLIAGVTALRFMDAVDGIAVSSFKLSHFRFDALLIGVLLNYLWRNDSPVIAWIKQQDWKLLLFIVPVLASCHVFSRNSWPMFTLGFSLLSIAYSMLLILAFENWAGRIQQSRFAHGLSGIGKWSYNIYLWHCLWPLFFRPQIGAFNQALADIGLPPVLVFLVDFLIYAAVSIGLGYLMTRFVEDRFLGMRKKYITQRYSPFKARRDQKP